MRIFGCVESRAEIDILTATISVATILCLGGVTPAFAIPSPELVVGSFTSISQLIALASALIGGGATLVTMRARARNGGQATLSRWLIAVMAGCVVLLMTSVGFNIYQYVGTKNERHARLEQTLLRPATTPGGPKLDPANLELSYAQMIKEPRGISTEETQRLLEATARGERNDLLFLDVRETAERDTGIVPGATFIRFPDFKAANVDFTGKQAVFFCHNGNRSWETCEALTKLGIDCRFVVGGLEKWIVEGRPFVGLKDRTLEDLRAIPDCRNHDVLLDTPQVHELVKKEGAIFVDGRYGQEFAAGHLPGAINLTIRATPSAELPAKIAAIPKKPIILPCYDRRGCFFSEVLGLELTRAGLDFRGRYTLPWEYFPPRGRPPHVDQWVAENDKSIWVKAGSRLAAAISGLAQWTGLIGAVLLLAIISRLLVLPFSVKAERDQIRARAFSDELEALKTRLKSDPLRRTRAIRAFYRRHRFTPLRNLIALLFLPIMAVALLGVQEAVSKSDAHVLWLANLAQRDPWLILPILFAALITLYVDMAFARSVRQRIAIWIVGVPLLTATGALFSAGADIYLVASAALLLLQRMAVAGDFGRLRRMWHGVGLTDRIITLDDPARLSDYGNKAYRLARMRAEGMPVPNGLLLAPDFLEDFASGSAQWRRARLDEIWRRLGKERVVVRSSADVEDGADRSFAGVFESVLDVDRDGLEAAMLKVKASFTSDRAKNYAGAAGRGSILVQRMVAADYAGVLFTQDPAAGGISMIELVEGTAENLVSGRVRPQTCRFGRVSGQPVGEEKPPIDLKPLLALGRQAEALFGAPQDVEWTWKNGEFYLVQSRNITSQMSAVQRSLARVLDVAKGHRAEEIVFAKNELSEMLPRPTRLSLSLMEALWASGGSVDLACRALGLSYAVEEDAPDYLVTVFGRLYVNKVQEQRRALNVGPFAARRLARHAGDIERHFREIFLPKFLGDVRIVEAVDFDKLSTPDLFDAVRRLHDKFVYETHVEVDVVNVAANVYLTQARELLARHGLDPSTFLGRIPETSEARALAEAAHAPRDERRLLLAASIGHRAVLDYELSEPRYAECPQALDDLPSTHRLPHQGPQSVAEDAALADAGKRVVGAVETARRFQALKEDARHHSLREVAVLRRAVLALDARLGLGGLSFFLRFQELLDLRAPPSDVLRGLAEERQKERTLLLDHPPLAATLTARDLEIVSMGGQTARGELSGLVRGTRVSGSGVVTGRARVVADADAECGRPIDNFEDGDIIVASMIHPAWLPYFERAGGFVCEVGGWLSHTAILAREFNATMIVGTRGLTAITDRGLLRLHPDGVVEPVGDDELLRAIAAE
jgi:rhodanese-related sulfurtransferase/phosphohistidine swiveling domain-containing protein